MANWHKYVLTEQGRSLLASAISGARTINLSHIKVSSHDYSQEDLGKLKDLSDVKQTFKLSNLDVINDNTVKIEACITNVELKESYVMRTIGVYALLGEEETLFAVAISDNSDTLSPVQNGVIKNILTKLYISTSNTNSVKIAIDFDMYVTRGQCVDLSHPIHSVYLAVGGDDPATLFGGTWKKIEGRYLRASGAVTSEWTLTAGDKGGEISHIWLKEEMPPHGHTRGTQNITGSFWADDSVYLSWYGKLEGAFEKGEYIGRGDHDSGGGGYQSGQVAFNAKNTWTGISSIEGEGKPMPLNPLYFVLDVWLRIA